MRIETGESLDDFLVRVCGYKNPAMLDSLQRLNPPETLAATDARDIFAYPCVYRRANPTIEIGKRLSVLGAAQRLIGTSGPRAQRAIAELNPGTKLASVPAGAKITLPFETHATTFLIRSDLPQSTAQDLTTTLGNSLGVTTVHATEPGHIIPSSSSDLSEADHQVCDHPSLANWPTDTAAVAKILTRYWNDRARHPTLSADPAVIAVVDTGIARGEISRLPFKLNTQEKESPPVKDWDHNGYPNDVIGVDLITQQGSPYVATNYPYADHGLQISSIASGASFLPDTSNIANFAKLKMLSIVEAIPAGGASSPSWRVVPGDFVTSISYIRSLGLQRPIVANWSWEASGYAPSVSERVSDGQELIAVAAGNRHAPLNNNEEAIPARFSLARGGYVIAVAALRPDGKLADFSNYGSMVVTLAAPGCGIPVFKSGGGITRADGTSMASPLVALTGAIVKTLDADASAEGLYKRIIASTNHLPALEGKVIGGRVLNIPDTISVYEDIVRLSNGTTLRGRITGDFTVIADNDQSAVPFGDVLRYDFAASSNGTLVVSMVMNRPKEELQTEQGTTRATLLKFLELGKSNATDIPVSTISTIIPAMVRD